VGEVRRRPSRGSRPPQRAPLAPRIPLRSIGPCRSIPAAIDRDTTGAIVGITVDGPRWRRFAVELDEALIVAERGRATGVPARWTANGLAISRKLGRDPQVVLIRRIDADEKPTEPAREDIADADVEGVAEPDDDDPEDDDGLRSRPPPPKLGRRARVEFQPCRCANCNAARAACAARLVTVEDQARAAPSSG
jgi:hypothetical protein